MSLRKQSKIKQKLAESFGKLAVFIKSAHGGGGLVRGYKTSVRQEE
jgi:hypothetical protein